MGGTTDPFYQYSLVGAYNDTANSLMISWFSTFAFPIDFYEVSGSTFNLIGSLTVPFGPRSGLRVYERRTGPGSGDVTYYFTLAISGVQYTYLINVTAGPALTFTLISTCEGSNISNYNWFDRKNYKEYLVTSNPELAVCSFFNNNLGNQLGQNNEIGKFNNIYYVPESNSAGDLYFTTINPNTLVASWGSLLQNPELVSSHVYQNPRISINLPKNILDTTTFQINNKFYVVYAYDEPASSGPVYLYIYDITDINNYIFIGTIFTNDTLLPIVRLNSVTFENQVFILCESDKTICIIFDINNIEGYISRTIATNVGTQIYSNLLIVNNNLYIYQATSNSGDFEIEKFIYNSNTNDFDNDQGPVIIPTPYGSNNTIHQVADLYYKLNNLYQIVVLISDSTASPATYDLYFISFNDISSVTYVINTGLTVDSTEITLVVQQNLDFSNQIFFNYEYDYLTSFIALYVVPPELNNITLTTLSNSNVSTLGFNIRNFSTLFNSVTDEIFLVVEGLAAQYFGYYSNY